MATKKKTTREGRSKTTRKGKGPKQDGSPIKVGGGGGRRKKGTRKLDPVIWCEFNHEHYPDPDPGRGPKKKTFENPNWHMKALSFKRRGVIVDLTPFLPDDGSCTINIERQGSDNDIEISGTPLGITFHDGTYQFVYGSDKKHQNGNSKKTKVKIKAGSFSNQEEFEPLDIWEIKADLIRPARRALKSRRSR